jgi:hypothetical protein
MVKPQTVSRKTHPDLTAAEKARLEKFGSLNFKAWVSRGTIQPGADDFAMLWLLFRTFVPQVGGLVLMLATSARR